jgi:hypothetical protein
VCDLRVLLCLSKELQSSNVLRCQLKILNILITIVICDKLLLGLVRGFHALVMARKSSCRFSKVNIVTPNKQSRTADKGWPSSLGVGRGANNSPP